ncbi:MAG: DUF3405 domain-containing protein, partial [Pseudomonadota bacterium]
MTSVPSASTAIVVLTHKIDRSISRFINELKSACGTEYNFYVLGDNTKGTLDTYHQDPDWFLFKKDQLSALSYPNKLGNLFQRDGKKTAHHSHFNFPPGFTDIPLLFFFKNKPGYDYYWLVEYDVRYSGSWRQFFSELNQSDADLLCTTLTRIEDLPDWFHWSTLSLNVPKESYLRGFCPIYRMSQKGLGVLHDRYLEGAAGHYEGVIPSLFRHQGLKIEDIGGEGDFVPEDRR